MPNMGKEFHSLLKEQFQEADKALQDRLQRWEDFYYSWRGMYKSDDEFKAKPTKTMEAYANFSDDVALYKTKTGASRTTPNIFVRETYMHIETVLTRLDEAFTSPRRPFSVRPPRVMPMPTAESLAAEGDPMQALVLRKDALEGVTQYLTYDYRYNGSREEHVKIFRDSLIFGTGYAYHRAIDTSVGRASIERIPPWMVRPHPYSENIRQCPYVIIERLVPCAQARKMWPEEAEAIKNAARTRDSIFSKGEDTELRKVRGTPKMKEVRVFEYWGMYDENADYGDDVSHMQGEGDVTLKRLWVLGDADGPTETLLGEVEENPYTHGEIPLQEFTFLHSPTEQGLWGIGAADLTDDNQQAVNAYFMLMLIQFGYATLQGGYYDASAHGGVSAAMKKGLPPPGVFYPMDFNNKDPRQIFWQPEFKNTFADHQRLFEMLRTMASRVTGVNDMNVGISTKTHTDTLGEVTALQHEGNLKFRFVAERLDTQFQRSISLYVNTFADALKVGGVGLVYVNEMDVPVSIAPELFDEPIEVEVNAGSTWIDDRLMSVEYLQLAQLIINAGAPDMALPILKKAALMKGLSPDDFPTPPPPVPAEAQAPPPEALAGNAPPPMNPPAQAGGGGILSPDVLSGVQAMMAEAQGGPVGAQELGVEI